MRLNDLSIKALKAPEKGYIVYPDDTVTGFGVRVTAAGVKSYVLTHGKLRKRETIGRVGILTLQKAREEAKRRLAEYTLGKTSIVAPRWNSAVTEFLAESGKRLKERTRKDYQRLLNRHFRFGDLKLTEITPPDIQRRIDKLGDTPMEQHHAFVVARTFFTWAHRKHYIDKHPMERMTSGFRYRPRSRILTGEELRKVWLAAGDDTFGIIAKLCIATGQRVGEITQITPDMIGEGTVTLPATLTKNSREHTFPVGPLAQSLLEHVPFETLPNRARAKTALDQASGVSGYTIHDLRRTYASGMASIGTPLPVIERLINHVSGSFGGIVGVYQRHDFAREMKEAVTKWEQHLIALTAPKVVPFERLRA